MMEELELPMDPNPEINNFQSAAVTDQKHVYRIKHIQIPIKIMIGCIKNIVITMINCAPYIRCI